MNHYVMDYETLTNCFLGVFEHYKTDEVEVFTIGKLRNDLDKFLTFLEKNVENNEFHISFNGLGFDSQITEFIIRNQTELSFMDGEEIAKTIYAKAQDCITRQTNKEWQEWSEKQLTIKQIDLFKLNHWDNPAKMSSLKWIQCSMRWHNVQDMPIDHTESIDTVEQLKEIASYCRNDVSSTKQVMDLSSKQITLRGQLTKDYGISLYSASEPRISKELFLYFLERKIGISKYELRQLRTRRELLVVKDLILPYIKFETPEFQELLENFSALQLDPLQLKGQFKASVNYRGVKTDFGLGGVHGAKRGIYEPEEHQTIMSSDVVSFYPNLIIRNGWSPAHLPSEDFCEQYEWFFNERKKIPKSDPRNYVYKIVLNSTYGLSNDQNSFLYDPELTMRVTINGQLSLMMLNEMIAENIPGAIPLMQNTDGVEFIISKRYKEKYLEICKEWEELTDLALEHDEYQKLIIPDVNNYIGVFKEKEVDQKTWLALQVSKPRDKFSRSDGKFYHSATKCKGRFEIDKALHKNHSFLAVTKALYYYFVHNIDPEVTISKNKDIFDYCGQTKSKGAWKFKETSVKKGDIVTTSLQKTLRYLVTNTGTKIIKENTEDNRQINVVAGRWLQTIFNVYEDKPWDEYNIDMKFYIDKAHREMKAMSPEIFKNQYTINF